MKTNLEVAALSASIALALATLTTGAEAQSVTIYGSVDVAVEHLTNVAPSGSGLTRMPSLTGSGPSRLGFRGSEPLGNGLSAEFNLEMGFAPDSGTLGQGGRVFGRYSYVGLASPWGRVTLGRFYSMLFWANVDADILGPNIYGLPSLDNYLAAARVDNAIAYRGTFDRFQVGLAGSLGRDTAGGCPGEIGNNQRACTAWSALLKYDADSWGLGYGIDKFRGGPGAAGGLINSNREDERQTINGYLRPLASTKVSAGWFRRVNDGTPATPKSNLYFVGAQYRLSQQVVFDGELSRIKYDNSPNKADMIALRASYEFTKRTALYVTGGHISNGGSLALSVSGGQPGGAPSAGGSQTGVTVGLRHVF